MKEDMRIVAWEGHTMAEEVGLRVVLFEDGGKWVAQCLEYDIGAQASDLRDLQTRFVLTLMADLQHSMETHGAAFAGIDPAPAYFHEMWDNRSGGFMPTRGPNILPGTDHLPPVSLDMALYA